MSIRRTDILWNARPSLPQRILWSRSNWIPRSRVPPISLIFRAIFDGVILAFVIHGRHSSITIYYCKYPNRYLADISRFGKKWQNHPLRNYNRRKLDTSKVRLHCAKKFSLRDTAQRIECFNVLARLIYYLWSGDAHVGYLKNYAENPLHRIVFTSHACGC